MGFMFDPDIKTEASSMLGEIMTQLKYEMESSNPFAMDPVVFNYSVNEQGTVAELCACSNLNECSAELPSTNNTVEGINHHKPSNQALNNLLKEQGFDTTLQEHIRSELRSGSIGLAKNRLPVDSKLSDVKEDDVILLNKNAIISRSVHSLGLDALSSGSVGIVTLAAGVGSRWTQGAGVVKALNPFCCIGGKHRNFLDVHLAKNRKVSSDAGITIPHVFTTSWMTHEPIKEYVESLGSNDIYLSLGSSIGLRMIPTVRDLKFLFQEQKQKLDEQAQKVQNSLHAALLGWAESNGEGSDYTLNVPKQCLCK